MIGTERAICQAQRSTRSYSLQILQRKYIYPARYLYLYISGESAAFTGKGALDFDSYLVTWLRYSRGENIWYKVGYRGRDAASFQTDAII